MKKTISMLLSALVISLCFSATAEAKLPQSWPEFKAEFKTQATTPKGAINMLFKGIYCFMRAVETNNPTLKADAAKMLRYTLYLDMPLEQSRNYATFYDRLKDKSYYYIYRSYCEGTSVENSYTMDPDNFTILFEKEMEQPDGCVKVLVRSTGADNLRPITCQKKPDGLWYTVNMNSVYVQVREPKSYIEEHMHDHDPDFD